MRVVAWNRTVRTNTDVEFMNLESVLAGSDVISIHLLLTDETRDIITPRPNCANETGNNPH